MKQYITTADWMKLDRDTRVKLMYEFKVPKSSVPMIVNNSLASDGHTAQDLMIMNIGRMMEYLSLTSLPQVEGEMCDYLFSKVLDKLNGKEDPRSEPVATERLPETKPARRGRPKKKASGI
jgi:hypothetical protein